MYPGLTVIRLLFEMTVKGLVEARVTLGLPVRTFPLFRPGLPLLPGGAADSPGIGHRRRGPPAGRQPRPKDELAPVVQRVAGSLKNIVASWNPSPVPASVLDTVDRHVETEPEQIAYLLGDLRHGRGSFRYKRDGAQKNFDHHAG